MNKTVIHQSIELGWLDPTEILSPKTLVLGSFNPYESETKSVDYYYGRTKNHFWRTIAFIIGKDDEYFFDSQNGFLRKKEIMQNRFCCLDVINSIDLHAQSSSILTDYLNNEIFMNYLDQKIWTGKTKYKNGDYITISRNYNQSIINFLNSTTSIKKVIHTMGINRISENSAKPKEIKLMDDGFNGFIKKIKETCRVKEISFILDSFSPSYYAVQNGKTKKEELNKWLTKNLWLEK